MKLSEWMELGHTLIGEQRDFFYSPESECGCGIGSVYAAFYFSEKDGLPPRLEQQSEYGGRNYVGWLEETFPWTQRTVFGELLEAFRFHKYHDPSESYALAISVLHNRPVRGVPRMEIAQMIRADEPPNFDYTPVATERKPDAEPVAAELATSGISTSAIKEN